MNTLETRTGSRSLYRLVRCAWGVLIVAAILNLIAATMNLLMQRYGWLSLNLSMLLVNALTCALLKRI